MSEPNSKSKPPAPGRVRWWPGIGLILLAATLVAWVRTRTDWPFQKRNLVTYEILILGLILLLAWWTFLSRAPKRLRLGVTFGCIGLALAGAAIFRVGGMSGDLMPILEFRWAARSDPASLPVLTSPGKGALLQPTGGVAPDFPQFYGPNRDGVLPGPVLETNWTAHPPRVIWRQPVGAGWSGFAVVGNVCLTQEERSDQECVVARALETGAILWVHADEAHYVTTIAGEGPRATPTVLSNRVFAFGATGILNCLDLTTGGVVWSRNVIKESGGQVPQWGATSSPLVVGGLVIVHGGEGGSHSLFAFDATTGEPAWQGGTSPSYATPILATLAGVPQVLAFNDGSVSGHDPATGATFWERPWGNGNVVCATPLVVSSNRVLFSSGYGVGAELLEIAPRGTDRLAATRIWKSIRLKSKFSHLYASNGCVVGLDDGILACVDLADGSLRWKEGRYGHGQGLLVGDLYLLMSEAGELVLLRPTPEAPNELARFRVFDSKTWNPPAMAGEVLLLRNDREAACLRLDVIR